MQSNFVTITISKRDLEIVAEMREPADNYDSKAWSRLRETCADKVDHLADEILEPDYLIPGFEDVAHDFLDVCRKADALLEATRDRHGV